MKSAFKVVPQHVARNPIARAVARKRFDDAVRTFALRVYLLEDGEDAHGDMLAAARCIAVAARVYELENRTTDPELRVLEGAMSAIEQCMRRGWKWRRLDAVAIDRGISIARDVIKHASAQSVQRAWADMI